MKLFKNNLFITLIEPRGSSIDGRRRELITNILLVSIIAISSLSLASNIITHLLHSAPKQSDALGTIIGFVLVMLIFWAMSRRGYYVYSAYGIIIVLLLVITQLIVQWSFELPIAELALAMIIVIAGVTLSAKAALQFSIIVSVYELIFGYLQTDHYLHPRNTWLVRLEFGDSIGYAVILIIIGLVSWLANRETDNSLTRARRSEAALEAERDSLEIKVAERTEALEKAQMERVMELQQLAEFGRMSAGVLHDVANPLTSAALDIKQLSDDSHSQLARQAMRSLQLIERFIVSARKQLKSQETIVEFNVSSEIKSVLRILDHQFRQAGVQSKLTVPAGCKLYGDPSKFNQIVANLIINAIEAYEGAPADNQRQVQVTVKPQPTSIVLQVYDHGRGLPDDIKAKIFEPFYSTKAGHQHNMGIGLTTVKQLVEKDFSGRITIKNDRPASTCFEVQLRNHRKPKRR